MKIIKIGLQILRDRGLSQFLKKTWSYSYNFFIQQTGLSSLIIPRIIRRLTRQANTVKSIDQIMDLAYSFRHAGISIQPRQEKEEIIGLLKVIERLRPKTVLEIGTAQGGTLFLFSKVSDPDATIISIDLPERWLRVEGYPKSKIPLYKSFASNNQIIHLIRHDSHDLQTLEEVKRILGNRRIDFCFIDGDHSYEGVRRDFEMYSTFVSDRGIVAFHDILMRPPQTRCQVSEFWNELKSLGYKHKEIVNDWNQKRAGIGVIYL